MATLNSNYQYIGRTSGVSCASGYNFYVLLYAKATGDIATGKHTVGVKMRLVCDKASTFYGYYTDGSVKVGGVSAISWDSKQIPNSTWNTTSITEGGVTYPRWIDLKEGTVVVNTGYGVAKDVKIEASWQRNSISGTVPNWLPYTTTITASITATLPIIPGATTIDSLACSTEYFTGELTYKYTPKSATLYNRCNIALNLDGEYTTVRAIYLDKKAVKQQTDTVTLSASELEAIYNKLPNAKKGKLRFTFRTYADADYTQQLGDPGYKEVTLVIPNDSTTQPSVQMSVEPIGSLPSAFNSLYIQGKTKVQATLSVETKYGAEIAESVITVDGKQYAYPYESEVLNNDGTVSVKATVKDTREYSGTAEQNVTVIPYSKPIVQAASGESNIVARRCDANGNIKDSGTYLKIKAKLVYEKVISDGVQHNFGKIQYRYRAEGGLWSDWYTILDSASSTDTEVITGALLDGALSVKTNYQVQVKAIDNLEESQPILLSVPSDDVYMDRPAGGKGMGLGGYNSGPGNLDVYWKTKARGGLSLFNAEGEEISVDETLPLPRGAVVEGWNPDHIVNGVHWVSTYPLKDAMGNVIMENGILIQMVATIDGAMKVQMAFPTDTHTPAYRVFQEDTWTPWYTWNILMI